MKAVFDATEAAFYLGYTEGAIRKLAQEGKIPYLKRGTKLMFLVRDLDRWLDGLRICNADDALKRNGVEHVVETPSPHRRVGSHTPSHDENAVRLSVTPSGRKFGSRSGSRGRTCTSGPHGSRGRCKWPRKGMRLGKSVDVAIPVVDHHLVVGESHDRARGAGFETRGILSVIAEDGNEEALGMGVGAGLDVLDGVTEDP
jgi:excisionase family DNA binding protein